MFRWVPYTFIRIAIFFCGGIALGIYFPGVIDVVVAEALLVILTCLYIILFSIFKSIGFTKFNLGWIGLPVIFFAGFVNLMLRTENRQPGHLTAISDNIQYYTAVINRYTEEKEHSWKVEARVREVSVKDQWQKTHGKIILYFPKSDFKVPFEYGDVLLIKGSPQSVPPPSNPGEFDYKRFLTFRNIYHQHFLRKENVKFLENDPPSTFMHYALQGRDWADTTLKQFVTGEREQAIASALVLGVADGLDNELLNAYAATGAMHVLAVSGLHISIIYMILLLLLKPLNKLKSGAWIIAIVSLFILWAYAFITGLSPSVLRAVTMFSFVAVARPTLQSTNIYNTLAASAVCLLVFDPYLIMSVGFQLSYLAVLGIVYLQNGLYQRWEARTWLGDQIWKITCVSIAAQVATFALGLLYFHQFPNYFLLSNLLVIPVSFAVLIEGIIVLAFSFIPLAGSVVGFLLTWTIKFLNVIVFTVETFPFSLVEDIYITTYQCWLLMGIILCLILLLQFKRFSYLTAAAALTVAFSFEQWDHFAHNISVQKITIYNVKGHNAMDLMDRGHAYFFTDSTLQNDRDKIRFHIRPNRMMTGIGRISTNNATLVRQIPGGELLVWKQKMIVRITHSDFVFPEDIHPDLIVVGNNSMKDPGILEKPGSQIILDSSNSFSFANRFLARAAKHNMNVYSVLHQGAFEFVITPFHS